MRNVTVRMIWVLTFLMAGLVAGCGREQTIVQPPSVTSTVPTNGATVVPVKQVITATFNAPMDPATINTSTFTVTGPGGAPVTGTVTFSGTTATFTPAASLAGSTLYTATITTGAKDPVGDALPSNFVWTFTTGPIPIVTSTNPLNGAVNVARNQKITATFSQPMSSATITAAGTFTLAVAGVGGAAVPGTVTYVAATNTATFAPTATLLASTQYTATINTAAQSAAGNSLASNFVWSFTTGVTSDITPPIIITTNPPSGALSVPTNQTVTATFSKAMDPATITAAGTFALAVTAGGAAVAGTVSYAGTTATFTPAANLTANTQFTATITAAAKDLSGNALIAGAVPDPWSFTTGAGPDVTPPTITLTSPANADINVALNAAVNATFSKPMNPATITAPGTFAVKASVSGVAVAGNVTYDPISRIATFTPAANLTATTQYTATITNAAKDLAGNALAAGAKANPWTFTTGASVAPSGVNLGAASTFGAFGGAAGITNQGINTVINGDIGTTAASTLVTGFHDTTVPYIQFSGGCIYTETTLNVGTVNGTIFTAPPPPTTLTCPNEGTAATFATATAALASAQTAFNTLAAMPSTGDPGANLGGLTLAPGVWKPAGGSLQITGSDLTLDAGGNANAVFVFQMPASTLTVGASGAPRSIILINGAQAKNVFWQVGSQATINPGGGGTMVGTIIASAGVVFSTAGTPPVTTLNGRALSLVASVTMVNTVVNVPAP